MEQKIKFIIIGLISILLISILINLQTYISKRSLGREIQRINNDNNLLQKDIDAKIKNIRDLQEKVDLLTQDLETLSEEKNDIQRKYELSSKTKNELVEQLEILREKLRTAEKPQGPSVLPSPQEGVAPPPEDIYWAEILKAKTDLELQLDNLRNELKTAQINNEQLQREKTFIELDVKSFKRENEDLRRQMEYNQKVLNSITQEAVRERGDKFKIEDMFKAIKNENLLLKRQLKSLIDRKIKLEKKVQELGENNSRLANQFSEMELMLRDKMEKVNQLTQELDKFSSGAQREISRQGEKEGPVELPPIVVRPQVETAIQEDEDFLLGRVIGINKENNFVIVDIGEDWGVNLGDTFQVYREGQDSFIAVIEVIQLRQSIAACDIKKEISPIKIGDTIR